MSFGKHNQILRQFLFAILGAFAFVQMALPHGYALQNASDAKPIISFLKSSENGGFKPFLTLHSIVKTPSEAQKEFANQEDFALYAKILIIVPLVALPFLISYLANTPAKWVAVFRDLSPHFALLYLPPKTGPPKFPF